VKVTISAHCFYCARSFVLHRDAQGQPEGEDRDGKLCCSDCFCLDCGSGHITERDADTCTYLHDYANPVDDDDAFTYGDSDAAYDRHRDELMTLELTS
jgi:hypothetical protein